MAYNLMVFASAGRFDKITYVLIACQNYQKLIIVFFFVFWENGLSACFLSCNNTIY